MQASKGGKQPRLLHSYDAYEPPQPPEWHDNPRGTLVAHVPWR